MTNGRSRRAAVGSLLLARREFLRHAAGMLTIGEAAQASAQQREVSLALSESLVGDFNVADARAAMTVWIRRIAQDLKLDIAVAPQVFEPPARLFARLRAGSVDTVAVTVSEYRQIVGSLDRTEITVPSQRTKLEYVLLVRSDGAVTRVSQLRGKKLVMLKSMATHVAPAWLSNLVAGEEPGGTEKFFATVTNELKPSRVMLPVFFGQMDACVATQQAFATMCELNPQVGERMRPIAVSPEVVPSLYAYRRGWDPAKRQLVAKVLADVRSSTAGRQVLTMFQCDALTVRHPSCLDPTLSILEQYERTGRKFSGTLRGEGRA